VGGVGKTTDAQLQRQTAALQRLRPLLEAASANLSAAIANIPADQRALRLGDVNIALGGTDISAPTRALLEAIKTELVVKISGR
jgi:hypothetical protein